MQVGLITIDGRQVGIITQAAYTPDLTTPALGGGEMPMSSRGGDLGGDAGGARHGGRHSPGHHRGESHHDGGHHDQTHHDGAHVRDHSKKLREQDRGPVTLGKGEDPRGMEGHIRSEAKRYGVDPDIAVRVAKSEGLRDPVGDRGMSHGAFQLYKGGGLGNEFQKETGLDPADPANEKATISWALKNVGRTGWEPYHGAARVGIGHREGIDGITRSAPTSFEGVDATGIRGGANHMRGQYGGPGENLKQIQLASGKTLTVHSNAAESFKGFLDELEGTGYKINSVAGYANRNIRGGSGLSQHAYGNAIDVNPDQNPMGGSLVTNLPSNVSDMAAKHGLSWGGDWRGRKDAMHFEWMGRRPKGKVASAEKPFDPETMAP